LIVFFPLVEDNQRGYSPAKTPWTFQPSYVRTSSHITYHCTYSIYKQALILFISHRSSIILYNTQPYQKSWVPPFCCFFSVAAGKRAWQMAATQAYSYVSPKLASVSRIGKPEDVGVLNRVEIGLGKCANFKRQPHHPTNIYIYLYLYLYLYCLSIINIIVHLFHLQQKFEIYGTCM
jgi:hypothetical protein